MMRGMRPLVVVLVVACGHAPPAKSPTEQPVATMADIAGKWVTSDDMDWSYALTIDGNGGFDLVVDRVKMGKCEQKCTVAPGAAPKKFQITYVKNECNRDLGGAVLQLEVTSFTGDALTLVITGFGSQEQHTFTRAPAPPVLVMQ
jgi:hypothetical protein